MGIDRGIRIGPANGRPGNLLHLRAQQGSRKGVATKRITARRQNDVHRVLGTRRKHFDFAIDRCLVGAHKFDFINCAGADIVDREHGPA